MTEWRTQQQKRQPISSAQPFRALGAQNLSLLSPASHQLLWSRLAAFDASAKTNTHAPRNSRAEVPAQGTAHLKRLAAPCLAIPAYLTADFSGLVDHETISDNPTDPTPNFPIRIFVPPSTLADLTANVFRKT